MDLIYQARMRQCQRSRSTRVQRPGSRSTSIIQSLDQINEDEEVEEETDITEADDRENEDNDNKSEITYMNVPIGFKNYRGSLTRKDEIIQVETPSSNDATSVDSKSVASSNSAQSLGLSLKSQERISRFVPKSPRGSFNVPDQVGTSLKRSESQNRADFLLKIMTNGGDVNSFKSTSHTVIEKRSPTGRKIIVDGRPRSKDTTNTF